MKIRGIFPTTAVIIIPASLFLAACAGHRRPAPAPVLSADARMNQVYDLLKADKPDEAGALLQQILQSNPEDRRARLEMSYLQIRSKRWKDALLLLDSLLDEDPTDMRLRMQRGYVREAMGDLYAAADEFRIVARESNEFQSQAHEALKEIASKSLPTAREIASTALLNEGYEDLKHGDKKAAKEKFREALIEDPGNTEISKQLGYMTVADGNTAEAAADFQGVSRLTPLDYESQLELGYLYDGLHDEAGARAAFAAALPSPDPRIHGEAARALKEIYGRSDPLYLDIDASPYYTSRFGDTIANLEADAGYRPYWAGPFSFYLAARYTQDSRSHGGAEPALYDDDYVSLSPGIRFQPRGYNVTLSADYGPAINFIPDSVHPRVVEYDARVLLADYHYWQGPLRLFADFNGSVGFYSRYENDVIGYAQLRGGIKAWDNGSSQISIYAPINVDKDTNNEYFDNLDEVGGGLEFQPWTKINLKIRGEYLYGTYMGIQTATDPNPYGSHYTDIRVTLLFSVHFTKQQKPEELPRKPAKNPFLW